MQTILNGKTLNSRKKIFCQECESTSVVKISLRKIQFYRYTNADLRIFLYICVHIKSNTKQIMHS